MERTYTMEEIQMVLANLDNGIPEPSQDMRTKLPIPKEYGGGWATGNSVEEAVRNLINKVKNKLPTTAEDILFSDCSERWLAIKKGEKRSPSTIACYERILKKNLLPFFGKKYMGQIKAEDIQRYFNKYIDQSKSISVQSKAILSGMFEFAEKNDLIAKNPMRFKYERSKKVGKKVVLQDQDLISVIDQLEKLEGSDYLYACLLCFTALRRGEILGLKWGDMDFDKREIHVVRSVSYPDGDNNPVVGAPKDDSNGTVHLNSELARRIEEYLGKPGTYVIPYSRTENRRPITKSMFTKMWRRINKAIDMKGATSHSFRASYATMMNAHCQHIDPKALQGALRHKTPDLALKVYTKENTDKTRVAEIEYDRWLKGQIAT